MVGGFGGYSLRDFRGWLQAVDCSLSANDSAPPGWSELGFHAKVTNAGAADTQVLSFACVSSSAPLTHTLCTEFGLPARCSLALSLVLLWFLAYGGPSSLFCVHGSGCEEGLRTFKSLISSLAESSNSGRSTAVPVISIVAGTKELDQSPPPKVGP